jgi:hypothetical protein
MIPFTNAVDALLIRASATDNNRLIEYMYLLRELGARFLVTKILLLAWSEEITPRAEPIYELTRSATALLANSGNNDF